MAQFHLPQNAMESCPARGPFSGRVEEYSFLFPSGRSGLRPSLVRGDSPRNAPLTQPAVDVLRGDSRIFVDQALDVAVRRSKFGSSGRSGLRPSLVRGDSPRNAPLTPFHPPGVGFNATLCNLQHNAPPPIRRTPRPRQGQAARLPCASPKSR